MCESVLETSSFLSLLYLYHNHFVTYCLYYFKINSFIIFNLK